MSSKEFPKISGTYLLLMNLSYPKKIKVGALGELIFKPGRYIYVGSALKGRLYHRLLRHVKPAAQKKVHWHIDYFLQCSPSVLIIEKLFIFPSTDRYECDFAQILQNYADCSIPKFGSSDCSCNSHLFYFNSKNEFSLLL